MKNDLQAVWERYVSSWNTARAAERREIFGQCLAPDCVYTDPLTQAKGWDELGQYMASLQEQLPGARFVTEYFLAHHRRSIARWKMLDRAGNEISSGTSYGEYDAESRLVAMSGFFEAPGTAAA